MPRISAQRDPLEADVQRSGTGRPRKRKLALLLYCLLGIVALWALIGFLATIPLVGSHPYWREFRAEPQDFGLQAETVSFPSIDGIPLSGWYVPSPGPAQGTIILSHGINGNRSDMLPRAAFLVRDNYNVLLIDLRGHGKSGGNYAGPGYLESRDVLGAVRYLRKRGQKGAIVAMGHSYGAVASLYAASQSPEIAAVVADSAFISFEDLVRRATIMLARDPERSFFERAGLRLAGLPTVLHALMPMFYLRTGVWVSPRQADSLDAVIRIGRRPILFIAGQKDEICPPENARRMYDAALSPASELFVVPNAEHDTTYTIDPSVYASTVGSFLARVASLHDGVR